MSQAHIGTRKMLLRRGILPLIEKGEDLISILNRIIQNVEGQADKMLAAVFFYDPSSDDLCVGAAPNLQPSYVKAVNGFKVGPQQPACGSAVFKKEKVISPDVRHDELWKDLAEFAVGAGLIAVWSQPILDQNESVLGTIAFYFSEPKAPDESDLVILETTAELAALAIQSRRTQFAQLSRTLRPWLP
jgi:GAF domain-containing protein